MAGGGGRGTRAVFSEAEIEPAYQRCRSEAETAFGCGDVYVEQYIPRARHIEVQILGDLSGTVTHLGERECSIQPAGDEIADMIGPDGSAGIASPIQGMIVAISEENSIGVRR